MMAEKKRVLFDLRLSTFSKVIAGYLVLGAVLLTSALIITINLSVNTMREKIENTLMSTAKSIAGSRWVVDMLSLDRPDLALAEYLDYLTDNTNDIALITVADVSSKRLYHYNKELIGRHFVGGDEQRATLGESYFSDAVGTAGYQRRAFTPVYGENGAVIGFVMVSTMMTRLETMRGEIISAYLRITLILVPVTAFVALALSTSIRDELMGFEPDKLIRSFITRGDVLDALDEGILSVDDSGTILFANHAAVRILGEENDVQGRNILTYLDERHKDLLSLDLPVYNRDMSVRGASVLYDRLPPKQKGQGYILILRNKNEATRLAEELTGTKHMLSALRANTHEFMNKLHVIWGLLSMGQADEACSYISHISQIQEESITPIMRLIENPTVAGLLLGKISHMRETDIYFVLTRHSSLPRHSRYLSTRALVTVLGNLIENAIEAIGEQHGQCEQKIELKILEDNTGLLIWIYDTGIGMEPNEAEKIFRLNYSTKGPGRGTGLSLIQDIVDASGGSIEVESEKCAGTSVTIFISRPRQGGTA